MKVSNNEGGRRRRSRSRNKDKNIDKNNSTNKNRLVHKVIETITIVSNRSMDQNTKKKYWTGKPKANLFFIDKSKRKEITRINKNKFKNKKLNNKSIDQKKEPKKNTRRRNLMIFITKKNTIQNHKIRNLLKSRRK